MDCFIWGNPHEGFPHQRSMRALARFGTEFQGQTLSVTAFAVPALPLTGANQVACLFTLALLLLQCAALPPHLFTLHSYLLLVFAENKNSLPPMGQADACGTTQFDGEISHCPLIPDNAGARRGISSPHLTNPFTRLCLPPSHRSGGSLQDEHPATTFDQRFFSL